MASRSMGGMVPILHHLRHGCSHTTCISFSTGTARGRRTEPVVRLTLVPTGLHQKAGFFAAVAGGQSSAFLEHLPFYGDFCVLDGFTCLAATFRDGVEVIGQLGRHVLGFKDALVGVANDGTIAVIGGEDDEAGVPEVEDIERGFAS